MEIVLDRKVLSQNVEIVLDGWIFLMKKRSTGVNPKKGLLNSINAFYQTIIYRVREKEQKNNLGH